jgi:hypothetical protein
MLAAALEHVDRGGWVFPCEIGGKRPAIPRGFLGARCDRQQVLNWFEGRYAGHNLASPTGYPCSDVLDVDVRPNGSGWAAFERLKDAGQLAGAHRLVRTPSGGAHLYFAGTAQRGGSLRGEHLDFKARGGYVLLPPSVVGGRRYEVIADRPPTGAVLDWEAAKNFLSPPRPYRSPRAWRGGGAQNLVGWLEGEVEGNRNAALYWAASRAAEIGDEEVLEQLAAVAVRAGLDESEVRRTIASAVRGFSE